MHGSVEPALSSSVPGPTRLQRIARHQCFQMPHIPNPNPQLAHLSSLTRDLTLPQAANSVKGGTDIQEMHGARVEILDTAMVSC